MTNGPDDFGAVMHALGLTGPAAEPWRDGWVASQATYPSGGPEFLQPAFVREQCRALCIAEDARDAVVESLGVFDGNEPLARLAWHFHAGGCLLWPQDVDWGRKVYRTQERKDVP